MSIYLITNRSVTDGQLSNNGKERGLTTFRIAQCQIAEEDVEFKFLPDLTGENVYRDVTTDDKHKQPIKSMLDSAQELKGSENLFINLYKQLIRCDTDSDVLFFIHGFANDVDSSKDAILALNKKYVDNPDSAVEHLVFFAWPTIGSTFLSYWNDQEDAEIAGTVVARLIGLLRGFYIDAFEREQLHRCNHRLHLMSHSMGNQVLGHALQALPKQKVFRIFEEVILLNADIENDAFELGEPFEKIPVICERASVYIHRSDDALRVSRFTKNLNKRLGHRGPSNLDKLAENVFIVDTTNVKQDVDASILTRLRERVADHWGYLLRQGVINDINAVLKGEDESSISTRNKHKEKKQWYVL